MTGKKVYLILQSVLCGALAALLIASALGIYREGLERKARDPREPIYTREIVAERLGRLAPLFLLTLGSGAAGLLLGVKDEKSEKPVSDAALGRDPAAERARTPKPAGKRTGLLRAALILAAAGLIAAGVLNGSARDVLVKAVKICTECVGLG